MYIVKCVSREKSGKDCKISNRMPRDEAERLAKNIFFNSDYEYVAVESIDGMIVCEYEI